MNKSYNIEVSPTEISLPVLERFYNSLKKNINSSKVSVENFQAGISTITGSPEVVAVNSGTSALHLALILVGVKEGDEVLCPAFTFAATANSIMYLKAKPVFVDSEEETLNMCPQLLEFAICSRMKQNRKPKAVVVVHSYGIPAQLDEIKRICERYDIKLIEDAASALGSKYKNQHLGVVGNMGILSFNYNKILSTTGGGALLLKNKEDSEKANYLSNQAKELLPFYEHHSIGYNYKLSGMCAELGIQQFEELTGRIVRKRKIYERYFSSLNNTGIVRFIKEPAYCFSNRWVTTVFFNDKNIQNEVKSILEEKRIETRFLWKPMHLQPVFSTCLSFINNNSERFFQTGLCLPSGTNLSEDEQNQVIESIRVIF